MQVVFTKFFKLLARVIGLATILATLAACSTTKDPSDPTLKWEACGARIENGTAGECVTASVPLLWSDKDGQKIDISVKRILSNKNTAGQLWLLDGGPGDSGWTFEHKDLPTMTTWLAAGWDIYIYSHRGTGNGTRLRCSNIKDDSLDQIVACGKELKAKWGNGLQGFTSYEAARDLNYLIDQSQQKNQKVSVLGISYGTYLAQRYLQLYPEQADSVVLDSILPLGVEVALQGIFAEEAIFEFYNSCKATQSCADNLGDPKLALIKAQQQLDDKLCPIANAGVTYDDLLEVLLFLFSGDVEIKLLGPAVIARINRCSESDLIELQQFATVFEALFDNSDSDDSDDGSSQELGYNVSALDITRSIDVAALREAYKDNLIVSVESFLQCNSDLWPSFSGYKRNDVQSKVLVPTLILSGSFDVQTPPVWNRSAAQSLGVGSDHFLFFPARGHAVTGESDCAAKLVLDFINNPNASLDSSCIKTINSIDFAGEATTTQMLSKQVFGTSKLWGSNE